MSRPRTDSIAPILAVNFVGTLGFSIVLPFLVFLVTRWGGNALVYGVIGAAYSGFQLVGAPVLGRWSDAYGRRRILLLSQLGTLASWVLLLAAFALPDEPWLEVSSPGVGSFAVTLPLVVLFVARSIDGLTGGNVSVAQAYLADITSERDRNANFGRMAASGNLGFVVGPAIAGALGGTAWGELPPVLAALAVSVVASLLIAFRLPESTPSVLRRSPEITSVGQVLGPDHKPCIRLQQDSRLGLRGALSTAGLPLVLSVHFLVMLAFNFFYVGFPIHAARGLAWSVGEVGVLFSFLGVSMALVQGPILARATRRLDDRTLAWGGGMILAACFPLLASRETALLYAGAALMALGNGLMWPSLLSILSRAAGTRHQGVVQGFAGSAGAVASILGLLVGGLLFDVLEARTFWVASGIILLSSVLCLGLPRTEGSPG